MGPPLRIGILVVAYNAATTLRSVLARIPEPVRPRITSVLVSDDHSVDDTYGVGLEVQREEVGLPITVVRQPRNLGYGGNQKFGYRWAIEQQLDAVVMLHGDGQYAPEVIDDIVGPIERGEAEAVMGSRMLTRGAALAGGMPRYKYVGNRILTTFQNAVTDLSLSEWHSGYRAFSVPALASIPFMQNSDGFDFDTEVLLQLHDVGARIVEVPIPTYYGDEICYVDGVGYARSVVADVLRYRFQRIGFGAQSLAIAERPVEAQPDRGPLVEWLIERPSGSALDLGCAEGRIAGALRTAGHTVTGVDRVRHEGVDDRVDTFVEADLDDGVPREVSAGEPYSLVVAADVLEHLRDPERLLVELHDVIADGGRLILSVPNFGHWYPRLRVVSGRFDYDRRGILDGGHLRFFSQRSFERVLHRAGWHVVRSSATGLPFAVADRGGGDGRLADRLQRLLGRLDAALVQKRPTLFAYQLIYELEPALGAAL